MKESELRQHSACSVCGMEILHAGLPLFWRVTVERFGIDMQAAKRQTGLGMMLGSHALAAVMGPDEDIAVPLMEPKVLTFCEPCALRPLPIALALEA